MKKQISTPAGEVRPGTKIRIIKMMDANGKDYQASAYKGKTGTVTLIDDMGQLFGSWGGLAVIPGLDEFEII